MQHKENWAIGQHFINMEHESMHSVFEYCPYNISDKEGDEGFYDGYNGDIQEGRHGKAGVGEEVGQGASELEYGSKEEIRGNG